MTQKKENIKIVISLGLAGLFIAILVWLLLKISFTPTVDKLSSSSTESQSTSAGKTEQPVTTNSTSPVQARISLGEKILVTADTSPDKQAGVEAFASRDFATAINKFQLSLQTNRNDPEALIYLNNAKIGKSQSLKVVVSVAIGGNIDIAKEYLRGVAQAQDEVNRSGGINGVPLQVAIANDDADAAIAKQLAPEFVKDSGILAVVGHNRSEVAVAAGKIYNQNSLVMLTSVGTSQLSGIGKYIFRIVPTNSVSADTLARYIVQKARLKNIAICNDSSTLTSQTTKDEYANSIRQAGGKVTSTVCDFGVPDFNPNATMSRAISDGAEGLLLLPRIDKINSPIDMARANKGRLALFAFGGMYTIDTLQLGQADVKGMVLPVLWHPDAFPGNPFASNAAKLWGGRVNARTANSYDILQAVIAGLKEGNTREGLQKALSNPNFSASGATGTIQFLPSGDRKGTPLLVKVEPGQNSGTGYDFVLIQ